MKYKFELNNDIVVLSYKDKKLECKTNVKLLSEMQKLSAKARIKMIQDYAKEGQSIKDLTIVKKENGKTFYDDSNRQELENIYQQEMALEFFDNVCKENFKLSLLELIADIGLETEEEGEKFSSDLVNYLSGKIPR